LQEISKEGERDGALLRKRRSPVAPYKRADSLFFLNLGSRGRSSRLWWLQHDDLGIGEAANERSEYTQEEAEDDEHSGGPDVFRDHAVHVGGELLEIHRKTLLGNGNGNWGSNRSRMEGNGGTGSLRRERRATEPFSLLNQLCEGLNRAWNVYIVVLITLDTSRSEQKAVRNRTELKNRRAARSNRRDRKINADVQFDGRISFDAKALSDIWDSRGARISMEEGNRRNVIQLGD